METYIAAGIGALVSLVGSSLVFIISLRRIPSQNRKDDSEALSASADAVKSYAEAGQITVAQYSNVLHEVSSLRRELADHAARIRRLESQVISLGATPVA